MPVGYSAAMTEQRTAPDISPGYPSRGAVLGPAWAEIWTELEKDSRAWLDGKELAERVADRTDAQASTIVSLLGRAARAQILERDHRVVTVPINRGPGTEPGQVKRNRVFYRITEIGHMMAYRVAS